MGRDEAVENLLASGADTTIRDYDARPPFNYACIAAEREAIFQNRGIYPTRSEFLSTLSRQDTLKDYK